MDLHWVGRELVNRNFFFFLLSSMMHLVQQHRRVQLKIEPLVYYDINKNDTIFIAWDQLWDQRGISCGNTCCMGSVLGSPVGTVMGRGVPKKHDAITRFTSFPRTFPRTFPRINCGIIQTLTHFLNPTHRDLQGPDKIRGNALNKLIK